MPDFGRDPQAPEVDIDTFASAHAEGAAVLDVRNLDEYVEARVPGVTLIPLGELGARIGEVPEGRPLYVICATGARSMRAATALREQLGIDAINVGGGTMAWIRSGREVESGS